MDLPALHEPTTETVVLWALKIDQRSARALVDGLAQIYELQIDAVDERRRLMSIELRVTLTGDPFQITAFRQALLPRDEDDSDPWVRVLLNALTAAVREAIEKLHW